MTQAQKADQVDLMGGLVALVEWHFGLLPDQVKARTRKQPVAFARQVAMYVAVRCGVTRNMVGVYFGLSWKNVWHGVGVVEEQLSVDGEVRRLVEEVEKQVRMRLVPPRRLWVMRAGKVVRDYARRGNDFVRGTEKTLTLTKGI